MFERRGNVMSLRRFLGRFNALPRGGRKDGRMEEGTKRRKVETEERERERECRVVFQVNSLKHAAAL